MATFNLIRWQDELARELEHYVAMGRRGSFRIRLILKRAEKELFAAGYDCQQAYRLTRDACDVAELAVLCGGKR